MAPSPALKSVANRSAAFSFSLKYSLLSKFMVASTLSSVRPRAIATFERTVEQYRQDAAVEQLVPHAQPVAACFASHIDSGAQRIGSSVDARTFNQQTLRF